MKKKLLNIVPFCMLVCIATWTIAEQGGRKRADTKTPGTGVIQATLPKPLARLDGLDRLYFQHVEKPAEVLNAPPVVASLLPEFLRLTELNTRNAPSLPGGLNLHDFHLSSDSKESNLWIRQIVYADHPRIAKLWWALYDRGQ